MVALLSALALAGAAASTGPASVVRPELSAETVTIGDPIALTIRVSHRPDETFTVSEEVATLGKWGDFEILDHSYQKTTDGSVFILKVAAFRIGTFTTPALDLVGPRAVTVQRLKVTVTPTIGPEVKDPALKPLNPPLDLIEDNWTLLYVAIGLGALLVVGGIGLIAYRVGRKRGPEFAPAPPPRPAHEIALEKLAAIEAEQLLAAGHFKEFFSRVGDAFREYLGNRYGFDALERTTREILRELEAVGSRPGLALTTVEALLDEADLVKFAKFRPTEADGEIVMGQVRAFIDATKFVPVPALAEPANPSAEEKAA